MQQQARNFSSHRQQQPQPNADFMNMIKQRLMMEQQQKVQQQQHQQILSAQELLSQVNGTGNMNSMQGIGGLKQRLLEAARSLDTLHQPRQTMVPPHPLSQQSPQQQQYNAPGLGMNMGMGGMNGMNMNNIHQLMASQQVQQHQQPRNSDTVAALMNALEDTRNVAYSTQARLQQVTRDLANVQNNNTNRRPM